MLGTNELIHLVQIEDFPHFFVELGVVVAVVGIPPARTGVGVLAGKDGGGIRVNFLELLLLVCRYPGLLAELLTLV